MNAPRGRIVLTEMTYSPDDVILCDLWSYLSVTRKIAADRIPFVPPPETRAFLDRVPNACVSLPLDADTAPTRLALGSQRIVE